jgi:uncharacterized protein
LTTLQHRSALRAGAKTGAPGFAAFRFPFSAFLPYCLLMNDWVLITGASTGIGAEFARLFAADGFNLVLIARDEARLNALARSLKSEYPIETRVVLKDLALPEAAKGIFTATADLPVSILVNNAGFGGTGPFAASGLQKQSDMMQVNMTALVQLTHLFLQPMLKRHTGRILNVASTGAFQPGPFKAIYFATKSFVFSFSHALANEVAGSGVTVTVLCPGTTDTEFHQRSGGKPTAGGYSMMSAPSVALAGYRGLMQGRRTVIPGLFNKITALLVRLVPTRIATAGARRLSGRK